MIDKKEILTELRAIKSSQLFQRKKQINRFLEYIVRETLAGRGDKLTQHRIAIHALNKPQDFDPSENPAVRMEASRLRKLLDSYYLTEGFDNTIRIELPLGSYIPNFLSNHDHEQTIKISVGPIIAPCFQSLFLHDQTTLQLFHQIKNQLTLVFSRFHYIKTLSPFLINEQYVDDFQLLEKQPTVHEADFMMMLALEKHNQILRLSARVYHCKSRALIWENRYPLQLPLNEDELDHCYTNIAYEVFGEHHGIAHMHWSETLQNTPKIPPYKQSLISLNNSTTHPSADNFQQTINVCEQRLQQHPNDLLTHIALAKTFFLWFLNQCNFSQKQLAIWLNASREALRLAPSSAEAHTYFAAACFLNGDKALALAELDMVEKTNPYDYSLKYFAAIIHLLIGNTETSKSYYEDVHDISLCHPEWHNMLPFLLHYQAQEYDAALAILGPYDQENCWNMVMKAAALIQSQQFDKANQLINSLNQKHADKMAETIKHLSDHQENQHLLHQIWQCVIDHKE